LLKLITLVLPHLCISFKANIALKGPELNRDRSNARHSDVIPTNNNGAISSTGAVVEIIKIAPANPPMV
jgi:hypothetical protein